MRKKPNMIKKMQGDLKRKARSSAKQTLYMMMWGEEPPKKYRRYYK